MSKQKTFEDYVDTVIDEYTRTWKLEKLDIMQQFNIKMAMKLLYIEGIQIGGMDSDMANDAMNFYKTLDDVDK